MLDLYHMTLCCLVPLCFLIGYVNKRMHSDRQAAAASATTPSVTATMPEAQSKEFLAFQRQYLSVFWLCTFSDWLKGPYVYALYEEYGFSTTEISYLFVGGFGSSLLFGTVAGSWSDKWGRKRMCLLFCIVYGGSALTKMVNSFAVLMFGRILAGIATSLLFTTFEAWMVSEHRSRGYPSHLLTTTFSIATMGNGVAAIAAGVAAQAAANCCGYVAPFLIAIPCLITAFIIISLRWSENYGAANLHPLETLQRGYSSIRSEPKLMALGACQSLFEGAMYSWVFYWTPAISTPETKALIPYGIVFACYMSALMVGGCLSEMFTLSKIPPYLHSAAIGTMGSVAYFYDNKALVFLMFTLFEGCVGVYFPVHGTLRSAHIEESTRSSVMNFFRVPLNLYVVSLLHLELDPRSVVAILAATHVLSLVCYNLFARYADAEEKEKLDGGDSALKALKS